MRLEARWPPRAVDPVAVSDAHIAFRGAPRALPVGVDAADGRPPRRARAALSAPSAQQYRRGSDPYASTLASATRPCAASRPRRRPARHLDGTLRAVRATIQAAGEPARPTRASIEGVTPWHCID
jgi:hypothetical protein